MSEFVIGIIFIVASIFWIILRIFAASMHPAPSQDTSIERELMIGFVGVLIGIAFILDWFI